MDALVMCGGEGTRLDAATEKPLFEVGGRPMVDRVLDALADSGVDARYAAVSPHAPATREHLAGDDRATVVDTPGEGYVADLTTALDAVGAPAVTVAADLPLLAPDHVDRAVGRATAGGDPRSLTVRVPVALKDLLGASADEDAVDGLVPTGLNVVADDGTETMTTYDARLAINVNRRTDAELAERLLAGDREVTDG